MSQRTLLLIEDNPSDARLVTHAVERYAVRPWQVLHATDMPAAMQLLRTQGVDLVVLDLSLPGMQGMLTLKTFLDAAPQHAPVVVLTGDVRETTQKQAVAVGVAGFETKTAFTDHPAEFIALVEQCWAQRVLHE